MSVNKIILVGHLGQNPELKNFDSGSCVCQFSLATNEVYTDKNGEKVQNVNWHNIVIYGKMGENAYKYLKKGSEVYLEGKQRTRDYDGKDGIKRYITECVITNMQFVGKSGGSSSAKDSVPPPEQTTNNNTPEPENNSSYEDDGLPF